MLPPRAASVQQALVKFGAPRLPQGGEGRGGSSPARSGGSGHGAGALAAAAASPSRRPTPLRRCVANSIKAAAAPVNSSAWVRRVCAFLFTDDNYGTEERVESKRAVDGRVGQVRERGRERRGAGPGGAVPHVFYCFPPPRSLINPISAPPPPLHHFHTKNYSSTSLPRRRRSSWSG